MGGWSRDGRRTDKAMSGEQWDDGQARRDAEEAWRVRQAEQEGGKQGQATVGRQRQRTDTMMKSNEDD
jgi:hypothetical protein